MNIWGKNLQKRGSLNSRSGGKTSEVGMEELG